MKPIEAGCLAIVINDSVDSGNIGKKVKVLYLANKGIFCALSIIGNNVSGFLECDAWVVEGDVTLRGISNDPERRRTFVGKGVFETARGKGDSAFRPENLMRIDGGDEDLFKKEDQDIIFKEILQTENSFSQ